MEFFQAFYNGSTLIELEEQGNNASAGIVNTTYKYFTKSQVDPDNPSRILAVKDI
jgi:hypothetical protein